MVPLRILLAILLLIPLAEQAQHRSKVVKPVKKSKPQSTKLSLSAGITQSVLFLTRNIKDDNDAKGLNLNLCYGISRLMRADIEYTRYFPISIAPTWYDIQAYTVEANMHFITRFQDSKAYFYPLFGISYNVFSGFFTGDNDFQNLSALYERNQRITTRWMGVNAGLGIEQFIKPISIFGECKMRVGMSEGSSELNILDVCYSAGIRYNIKTRSLYGIFKGTRNRYFLNTQDDGL